MKTLSRKEMAALATIHVALRVLRTQGIPASVSMFSNVISISVYTDNAKETKKLEKLLCSFKEDEDEIVVREIPETESYAEMWFIDLKKRLI